MITKEQAYQQIKQLVERFAEQIDSYKSANYNETLTRRDFIDPFFKALGWDVDNSQGYAEAYREVIHEDRVKVGKATKAPDYSFRLPGGKRLFFVEAKKPIVDVKVDISVSYQIRRYGWSAKLPISIITDFEEFAVYDCTKKPNPTDKSGVARLKYFTFDKYLEEFDFLWDTFSKERVLKGSFDKYIQSDTIKKGTATVDKEFLISLDSWRTYLATSISTKNKELDEDEINFAVQQTIDRLIFLRIAEDRGVEIYGQLKNSVSATGDAYQNLFRNFRQADDKYNSGLFDFKKDKITENLKIDNKVIKTVINEMYYPESPYEFSVLSVEILGSAYEQFLGKQIKIDKSHKAVIEEKPEVRKAGGVFYTPQYVVDYIVENTIGKLIEGKTPKQIEKIKIADPACGSGSFLIGAYQYLLDYHKNYYNKKGTIAGKKDSPITLEGNLTSAEKKKILLNNIYGVDIDVNAVEVTKLSLLLKCMEGETANSISQQYQLWHERILPTLDDNIKSGNSLIDVNFYDEQIDFEPHLEKKVKPFSWKSKFPSVFNNGGFDVIIGNPPYVGRSSSFEELEKGYIKSNYTTSEGKYELYQLFIEKSTKLVKKQNAYISLITPQTWISIIQATKLRKYLISDFELNEIVFLGKDVFDASVDTIIFLLKTGSKTQKIKFIEGISKGNIGSLSTSKEISIENISKIDYVIPINQDEVSSLIINKIFKDSIFLDNIGKWSDGVKIVGKAKHYAFQNKKEDESFFPMYSGSDIERYRLNWSGLYCCRDKAKILKHNATDIRLRDEEIFKKKKIIVRKTGNKIIASIDSNSFYYEQSLFSFSLNSDVIDLKIILAVLNSSIGSILLSNDSFSKKDTFPQIRLHWLKKFPIKINKDKEELNEAIIKEVDLIVKSKEELSISKLPNKIEQIKSRIEHTENKINQLVYSLYQLSNDEIEIIEKEI